MEPEWPAPGPRVLLSARPSRAQVAGRPWGGVPLGPRQPWPWKRRALSSNLAWNNELGLLSTPPSPCPTQVYASAPSLTNSLSEAVWPGTGNVNADPLFLDAASGNYTPGVGSPAIDKGSTVAAVVPAVDYYGNPRPVGAAPDIGAIEAK